MYAQRNEDDFILEHFSKTCPKKGGRFLDIGAYDAKIFSQTRALYELLGWGGVLVEPAAGRFRALMRDYWNDPRITLVNAAITGGTAGFMPFYQCDDAVSTLDEEHRKKWESAAPMTPTHIFVVPYDRLIGAFPGPYDFINIDVEGSRNLEVFRAALAYDTGTRMYCVEYDAHLDEVLELASSKGFEEQYRTVENLILVRK